jgi:dethiobiotin synthetase
MDDHKAVKQALKLGRINNIVVAVCILAAIGFFFYGLINNIQAKKDKELALRSLVSLKECEAELSKQREYAAQANLEAEHQKRLAAEVFVKMLELQKKNK